MHYMRLRNPFPAENPNPAPLPPCQTAAYDVWVKGGRAAWLSGIEAVRAATA